MWIRDQLLIKTMERYLKRPLTEAEKNGKPIRYRTDDGLNKSVRIPKYHLSLFYAK